MQFFEKLKLSFLAKLISIFLRILMSAQIPPDVKIGSGTVFGYGGLAVVLHKNAVIGQNCRIGTSVTLGSKNPDTRAPVIGNNCFIGSGAKILGGVRVGDNCVIGANAVVTSDIPDCSVAVGIPARVVKRGIDITNYNENFYS